MNKSDTRIRKTQNKKEIVETEPPIPLKATPASGPCDACGNPIVPNKPTPNTNRPKRKTDDKDELIYTNGVQKEGNVVSVKVHPDSTNYMRTSKHGLSIKFLINKLECLNKGIGILKDNVRQLKDEVQPTAIAEKIVENSKEFKLDENGMLHIKLGDGLGDDEKGNVIVKVDGETIALDEHGRLITVWSDFIPDENE